MATQQPTARTRTTHRQALHQRTVFRALIICAQLGLLSGCGKPDYHTADGASGRFADARGKWLLINYWAEWCKPCIEEMPELQRFQQQHRDRVLLLTVNYDGARGESLQRQITKLDIKLPVLLDDPAPQLGYTRPDALPTTLVFDPEGKPHPMLQGAQTSATLAAAIGADKNTP